MIRRSAAGFTLLEVIVALAITGLALGALFGLLGGSKRLAFATSESLARTLYQRAAINAAQVEERPAYPEIDEREGPRVEVKAGALVEPPERQTREIRYALERYSVVDGEGEELLTSSRWKRLETAR